MDKKEKHTSTRNLSSTLEKTIASMNHAENIYSYMEVGYRVTYKQSMKLRRGIVIQKTPNFIALKNKEGRVDTISKASILCRDTIIINIFVSKDFKIEVESNVE